MAENSSIFALLQRYLDDELTETEYAELANWLEQYPDEEVWAEWLQELGMQQPVQAGYDRNRWQPVVEAILRRENALEEPQTAATPVRTLRRRILRWTAAAAIIGIGIGGYFLLSRPANRAGSPVVVVYNDIPAPTGSRTTLTLAGGQTILLDSMQNGTLAQQGNTRIAKLGNNQLVYSASAEKPTEVSYNTLSTAKGGQTMVVLADGTKVWLDAATMLTYPTAFTGPSRVVSLSGQAYFEVRANASQPFKVKVRGGQEVQVLGTAFNIMAYDEEPAIKTTLLEGSVRVALDSSTRESVILKPGQQSVLAVGDRSETARRLTLTSGVDIDEVLAWKNGQFQFDNAGTAAIMRQVARWYDVDIRYEGDVLQKHFSGGVPRAANVSALLHILELTKSVRFRVEGKQIIVQPYQ